MLEMLHARISRWRALGLSHPSRSMRRSKESIESLRALLAAIERRDGARAETIMRDETNKAAAEVMRLLSATPASP
jgi:DNA-binding GntR family transcriptional regulator